MNHPIPEVPWQVTGNHWLTLPCIHPADASIHLVGAVHARSRGAIEFAGDPDFINGRGKPLARLSFELNGAARDIGAEGIAWERELGWIPAFSARVDDISIRGVVCAPHGQEADVSGAVISLAIENRGKTPIRLAVGLEGTLAHRQRRIRTVRPFTDGHSVREGPRESVMLEGRSADSPLAIAIGAETAMDVATNDDGSWSLRSELTLAAGDSREVAFHVAVGSERDGAAAMLGVMRRRGAASLVRSTRAALREMEPATGMPAADRLIARHVFFAFFCSVARAIDDAQVYVVRSRIPWNGHGLTISDWEALMWILPAVQLADQGLGREVLLRVCEMHGYAPGGGVRYLDGSMFEPGFSLEGAAAYAVAVDSYIVQSADDKIVEEPVLADALYSSYDDMEARRHPRIPLFSTEVSPDGSVPRYAFTAHGNAVAALALDILKRTLDEKTAEKIQDSAAVRAAVMRQLGSSSAAKPTLASSADLEGKSDATDIASASMYWLPFFDFIPRDDSTYRRTVKQLESDAPTELAVRCARLIGPGSAEALEWLRRAPLDGGFAAESVDADGRATGNGGDAALSGLIAYTAWYAIHALGAKL